MTVFGCGENKPKPQQAHIVLIQVEPGVRLEVIDWGGTGEPLLFLAGLGNSAHIFDGFAPSFTDSYHVFGLSRRGFGASDIPENGYDPVTLTNDIRAVLDSLELPRVTLIGHSIAGEELTGFAGLYPERVNKLVYLDAAYDRTDLSFGADAPQDPAALEMTTADSASPAAVCAFYKRVNGVDFGISEITTTSRFSPAGRYLGDRTPDSVYAAMMRIFERPAYEKIQAPALSFYCLQDSVTRLFPYYNRLDAAQKEAARKVFKADSEFTRKQIYTFQTRVKQAKIVEMHGAHHHLFLSDSAQVSREIRNFLSEK